MLLSVVFIDTVWRLRRATSSKAKLYVQSGSYSTYKCIPSIPIFDLRPKLAAHAASQGYISSRVFVNPAKSTHFIAAMDLIDPLFDAVIKGDDSVVNHIISLGISLTVNDEEGLTVLHW